ncbi:hypothetical protein U1Q18_032029 [Sarracenia purpurea var. burkii]
MGIAADAYLEVLVWLADSPSVRALLSKPIGYHICCQHVVADCYQYAAKVLLGSSCYKKVYFAGSISSLLLQVGLRELLLWLLGGEVAAAAGVVWFFGLGWSGVCAGVISWSSLLVCRHPKCWWKLVVVAFW